MQRERVTRRSQAAMVVGWVSNTDGEPNNGESNQFDPEIAEKIYALCRQHKGIPVNTVGLGNYFKPQLSGFLIRVAQETGGSFLGR